MPNSNQRTPSDVDEALTRMAPNDPSAFGELYHCHMPQIYRYLLLRVGNIHDAQDLTAQTFFTAWQSMTRYQGTGNFAAWLMGIARHVVGDYFRYQRETIPLDTIHDFPDPSPTPDSVVDQALSLEEVTRALRELPSDRAEVITLRIFGGLSSAEVGQVMGKSEAAVKMLVHRALRDLQARLTFQLEDLDE